MSTTPPQDRQAYTHVLYVIANDVNCQQAQRVVAALPTPVRQSIAVQDAHDLGEQRPTWLDGVPTVADVRQRVVYKGSDAFRYLEHLRSSVDNHHQTGHTNQHTPPTGSRGQPLLSKAAANKTSTTFNIRPRDKTDESASVEDLMRDALAKRRALTRSQE